MDRLGDNFVKVLVLVAGATFFAFATFFAIFLVLSRPATPQGGVPVTGQDVLVEGLVVSLRTEPDKAIMMPLPVEGQATGLEQVVVAPLPTAELPTVTPVPPTPTPQPEVIFISYVVQTGDTLYAIAEVQNSSIELMARHGISTANLSPGTVLNLPVANPAFCPASRAYVVRDKDTVFRIANVFNTTAEAIRQLNNLDANFTIKTTQVICIPFG